jgi:hypothetical protein
MAELSPDTQKALEALSKAYPELEGLLKSTKALNKEFMSQFTWQQANWPKEQKQLEDHIKKIKLVSGPEGLTKFANALKTGNAGMEKYQAQLEALDRAIEDLADTTKDAEAGARKQQLQEQRDAMANKIAMAEFNARLLNTSKVLAGSLADTVTKTTGQFVRGLQGNASATEMTSTLMNGAVDLAAAGTNAFAGAAQGSGKILQTSTNPKLKMLGSVAEVAGDTLNGLAAGASKLAKFGIEVLGKELERTIKAYNESSAAGAMFADGMTGMRHAARDAGLTTEQFSNVVKQNSQSLAASGLGVAEGAKQMGRVGKEIRQSGVGEQLMKLGYGFEEQAELAATTAANMRRSTGGKASDQQIAEQTAKYAENLRVISAITGEDAKRKTDEAKQQNQILAFQQELAKKTPEQRAQIDAAMATMTEQEKKNFRDRVVLGTVINKEGAIYEATVAGARSKGEEALRLFENNELTAKKNADLNAQYGEQIKESINGNKSMGVASYAAGGVLQDVGKGMLDSVNQAVTYTAEAVKNGQAAVEQQKSTNDELTKSVMGAAEAAQQLKIDIQELLLPAITDYARVSKEILSKMREMVGGVMGAGTENWWDKTKRIGGAAVGGAALGAQAGGLAGGTVGTMALPVVGTVAGGTGGAIIGGVVGGLVGAIKEAFWGEPGKALGGISEGPASGYMEKLHGAEAVIPLDNNRSVPVNVNLSGIGQSLVEAMQSTSGASVTAVNPAIAGSGATASGSDLDDVMQQQLSILQEIKETLSASKDLQQQYVYNTYN